MATAVTRAQMLQTAQCKVSADRDKSRGDEVISKNDSWVSSCEDGFSYEA
jgi:hypothetical protein